MQRAPQAPAPNPVERRVSLAPAAPIAGTARNWFPRTIGTSSPSASNRP